MKPAGSQMDRSGPSMLRHVSTTQPMRRGVACRWVRLDNLVVPETTSRSVGARTGESGALGLLNVLMPTGMSRQVDFYLERSGGVADPDGLYFFLGGGNDLRDAARVSDPLQRMSAAQSAGANIAYSVRDLYLAGARRFVLINSPDIGLIPETIGDGLSEAGTDAAVQFNAWLGSYADYLRYAVPEFSLEYFDLFGLHHDLIAEYGLDAVRPCKSTPDTCDSALFFDSVHPTARVHEIFGNQLADQIIGITAQQNDFYSSAQTPIPEPCTGVLTLGGAAVVAVNVESNTRRTRRL